MNLLEIAGFVTGALSVWLAVRQNPWNWPFGVANFTLVAGSARP